MAVNVIGDADTTTEAVAAALKPYAEAHPAAEVEVYRYSPVSVWVRIVDSDFRGKSLSERHRVVWPLLYPIDEDYLSELTILVLIPPEEKETSVASQDFERARFAKVYSRVLTGSQATNGTAP